MNATAQKRLGHDERRERRRKIAESVRKGNPAHVVARTFGVGIETIRRACQENNVPVRIETPAPSAA